MGLCIGKKSKVKEFLAKWPEVKGQRYDSAPAQGEAEPKTVAIRLHFKCAGLKAEQEKQGPQTQLLLHEAKAGNNWQLVGQTEVVVGSCNPAYVTTPQVRYVESNPHQLRLELFVVQPELGQSLLGTCEFNIKELLQAENQRLVLPWLQGEAKNGTVVVVWEPVVDSSPPRLLTMQLEIEHCQSPNTQFSCRVFRPRCKPGATEPVQFLDEIDPLKNEDLLLVYYTNVGQLRPDTLHLDQHVYTWQPVSMEAANTLVVALEASDKNESEASGDAARVVKQVINMEVSIAKAIAEPQTVSFLHNGMEYGVLKASHVAIVDVPAESNRVMDFDQDSINLQVAVCIDFTRSNYPTATHTRDLEGNPYAQVLRAVLGCLIDYNISARIPLLGFGAHIPGIGRSHCFALNSNIFEPEVIGLSNVLEVYLNVLKKVRLSGPTYFAETLNYMADMAEEYKKVAYPEMPRYLAFMLIVDGIPNDPEETQEALARCSSLPMSVIVVGINEALCDGLAKLLDPESKGRARRDSVLYLAYDRKAASLANAAQTVYTKVQKQATEYMITNKVELRKSNQPEARIRSPFTQVSSAPGEGGFSPFPELLNKFKKELYEEKGSGQEDRDLLGPASPSRALLLKDSCRPFQNLPSPDETTRRDRMDHLLTEGFPTRDYNQFMDAAANIHFANPLLPS